MSICTEKKFKIYHVENPQIYMAFKEKALEAVKRKQHFSCRAIFHVLRWETMVSGKGDFKVWNDSSPYYGRLFEKDFPQHKGFFRKKKILASDYTSEDDYNA